MEREMYRYSNRECQGGIIGFSGRKQHKANFKFVKLVKKINSISFFVSPSLKEVRNTKNSLSRFCSLSSCLILFLTVLLFF